MIRRMGRTCPIDIGDEVIDGIVSNSADLIIDMSFVIFWSKNLSMLKKIFRKEYL